MGLAPNATPSRDLHFDPQLPPFYDVGTGRTAEHGLTITSGRILREARDELHRRLRAEYGDGPWVWDRERGQLTVPAALADDLDLRHVGQLAWEAVHDQMEAAESQLRPLREDRRRWI